MFKVDPTLFSSAENNIILGIKELETLKKCMNECALSFPDSYEFSKDVYEVFLKICNLNYDSDELLNKVTTTKKKLCELDKGFALTYYACALQAYSEVDGDLSVAQEEFISYSQKQYYDLLYEMLDENKDNLTPEQVEIYNALKEQKTIEKKYEDLQKLYQEKEDNNGIFHPIIESNLNKKIANLEKELGIYENKWYEDIGQAISKTSAEWSEGYKALYSGQGFGELWDATKQTFATGAVVSRSVKSGIAKLGELILVDGLSLVGGSLASGATWLFHDIWTDNDLADNVMDSTLDFVRRDLVDEANTNFYENTSLGNWINETSNLKYDSAGAKAIQTGSEFVGKIALATAATIVSGGMAAPIALGALYGTGKATERYTQSVDRNNGEEYSYDKALGKALAGAVGGSAEFYGYGRMGSAIYNGLKGLKNIGFKNIVSNAKSSPKLTFENLSNDLKNNFTKNFKSNFFEADTMWDTSAVLVDHGVNWLTGDENSSDLLKYGGLELLLALGLNAVGAGLGAFSESTVNAKMLSDFDKVNAIDVGSEISPDLNTSSRLRSTFNTKVVDGVEEINPTEVGFKLSPDLDDGSRLRSTFNSSSIKNIEEVNAIDVGSEISPDLNTGSRLRSTFNSSSIKNIDEVNAIDVGSEISPDLNTSSRLRSTFNTKVVDGVEEINPTEVGFKLSPDLDDGSRLRSTFNSSSIKNIEEVKAVDVMSDLSDLTKNDMDINISAKSQVYQEMENLYGTKRVLQKEWAGEFVDYFEKHNISQVELKKVQDILLSESNLENMYNNGSFTFMNEHALSSTGGRKAFFSYLNSIEEKITPEYLQNAINFSVSNIGENGNLVDSFIKYIVITNFDDINFKSTFSNLHNIGDSGKIICTLGDFELCKVDVELFDEDLICFDFLETRPNLKNSSVGSALFQKLANEVYDTFPDKKLAAFTLLRDNAGGIRFYEKNGGKFFELDNINKTLTSQEIDYTLPDKDIGVIFERSTLKQLSEKSIVPPKIENGLIIKNEIEPIQIIDNVRLEEIEMPKLTIDSDSINSEISDFSSMNKLELKILDNQTLIPSLEKIDISTKDLDDISSFLEAKSKNIDLKGTDFTYTYTTQNIDTDKLTSELNDILGLNESTYESIGVPVNGAKKFSSDYRLSIQNSDKIKHEDITKFMQEFHSKANGMEYSVKIKPGENDLIIIYVKNDNLYNTVNILENISPDLTKNFGMRKPFTVSASTDSYYGISSYVFNRMKVLGDMGRGGRTFSIHTGELLDTAYNNLYMKYSGDITKITSNEMYTEMLRAHKDYFDINSSEYVPLWMNKELYNSIHN